MYSGVLLPADFPFLPESYVREHDPSLPSGLDAAGAALRARRKVLKGSNKLVERKIVTLARRRERLLRAYVQQAMQQQMGANARMPPPANIERHPQFQDEWRRVLTQIEHQYIEHLNEYRRELIDIK